MPAVPAWPPKSLPRLFVEAPMGADLAVPLDRAQAHYIGTVMRRQVGDAALVFNGRDGEWLGEIVDLGKKRAMLRLTERTKEQELPTGVTLAFAPIKKGPIDILVEKAVELGVDVLQPVLTQRTNASRIGAERMEKTIIEAAEQCGRTALARLESPMRLEKWLASREPTPLYFADENGGAPVLDSYAAPPATLLVGPEGGFTDEERAMIRATPGAVAISLGPRILRAETAALAAIATYMARAGDWRS